MLLFQFCHSKITVCLKLLFMNGKIWKAKKKSKQLTKVKFLWLRHCLQRNPIYSDQDSIHSSFVVLEFHLSTMMERQRQTAHSYMGKAVQFVDVYILIILRFMQYTRCEAISARE